MSWMFVCFLIPSRDHRNYICVSILHRWFLEATSGTEKHKKQSPKLYLKKQGIYRGSHLQADRGVETTAPVQGQELVPPSACPACSSLRNSGTLAFW